MYLYNIFGPKYSLTLEMLVRAVKDDILARTVPI